MEAETICGHISDLMSDPDMAVGYDWVMDMREKYPSFTLPAALLLKRSPDTITAQQRKELVSWLALAATDPNFFINSSFSNMPYFPSSTENSSKRFTLSGSCPGL